jgi:tRNA-splicing ligase RtcB
MKVVTDEGQRVPVKLWIDNIEDGAMAQTRNLANLPFAFRHVAIMPDAHQGYGMPIGGVLATIGAVIPNAVGVDIGCGMLAAPTSLTVADLPPLRDVMGRIRELVPVGFAHQAKEQPEELMPHLDPLPVVSRQYVSALKQLGTLGGGNHFIEVQADPTGRVWIMIHSGSRNLGKQVADHYNKVAVELNALWLSEVPKAHELAFLPLETDEAQAYLAEMQYCVDFALANRQLMLERIVEAFGAGQITDETEIINIAHNYAAMENHFGKNVLVHRKGATKAYEGQLGIIPGSQGTASYIVGGLGNPESFKSCSHGAGRAMGRKDAKRRLNLEDEVAKLDRQGIIHGIRNVADLDEAAGAYKDIDEVMRQQADLVEIVTALRPLAVVKG